MAIIPTDLLDRIRDLERQVRELMGSANRSPAMNQIGGDVIIGDAGRLRVRTPMGEDLLYLGRVQPDRENGAPQQGLLLRRDDGSLALTVLTPDPGSTPVQPVRIFDRRGNTVFADDAERYGLARPYLAYPLPGPTDTARWASAGTTDWTTLYRGTGIAQHPRLYCRIGVAGGAGSAVRLLVDGVPTGPEGGPGADLDFTEVLPAEYGGTVTFEVQARVAATGDTVRCLPLALYGVAS